MLHRESTRHASTSWTRCAVAILVVSVGLTGSATAGDGVIEINQAKALSGGVSAGDMPGFPVTINQNGRYRLTGNLGTTGSPVIEVTSGTVGIDLNGFTVSGASSDTITANGADSLTLRDGTVQTGTFHRSVFVESTTYVAIGNVEVVSSGDGIRVTGVQRFAIRNNAVDASVGIYVGTFGDTIGAGTLEGNVVRNTGKGIWLSASTARSVDVRDNRIEGGEGIFFNACEGCTIASNSITVIGDEGIHLSGTLGSTIYRNTVRGGSEEGIEILGGCDGNLILENVVSGANNGMTVSGDANQIEGNLFTDNLSFGLFLVGSNNVYRRNTARSNGGNPGSCGGAPATTDICDETSGNTSHGDNYMPTPL